MEKNARNRFTSIILWFLTISLVVPMVHISALQDFIPENEKSVDGVDKPPSTNNVAETIRADFKGFGTRCKNQRKRI